MQDNKEKIKYIRFLLNRMGADTVENLLLYLTLLDIEFYWTDDFLDDRNRAEDAHSLRDDYIYQGGNTWGLTSTPSVLEVLVALAERSTFMDYDPAWTWFNTFIANLGFDYLSDSIWNDESKRYVIAATRKWLDRRFSPSGVGSPFRSNGRYDVSKTSIWSALQWYLADTYGEGHI